VFSKELGYREHLSSQIIRGLDERVEEFRSRELKAEYTFLWIDAVYEKVRSPGRVESVAVMIVYGVDRERQREVLAVEPALFNQWAGEDQPGDKAAEPGGRGVSAG